MGALKAVSFVCLFVCFWVSLLSVYSAVLIHKGIFWYFSFPAPCKQHSHAFPQIYEINPRFCLCSKGGRHIVTAECGLCEDGFYQTHFPPLLPMLLPFHLLRPPTKKKDKLPRCRKSWLKSMPPSFANNCGRCMKVREGLTSSGGGY